MASPSFRGANRTQENAQGNSKAVPATTSAQTRSKKEEKETRPPQGIFVLAEGGVDPVVDIVAVHGLDGHAFRSWTAPASAEQETPPLWLRDFLPAVLPTARIATYGYDGWARGSEPLSTQKLHQIGESLVARLASWRSGNKEQRRPLIFIAHSLGGIVVKEALLHADRATATHLPSHRPIKLSTAGILFIGTPHQGTAMVPLYKRVLSVLGWWMHTSDALLQHMDVHSEFLQRQQREWLSIAADFDTRQFYETRASKLPLAKPLVIVPTASAVLPGEVNVEAIALEGDHRSINKYQSAEDENFKTVAIHLRKIIYSCHPRIARNWAEWDRK